MSTSIIAVITLAVTKVSVALSRKAINVNSEMAQAKKEKKKQPSGDRTAKKSEYECGDLSGKWK